MTFRTTTTRPSTTAPVEQETKRIRMRSRIPSVTSCTTTTRPSTRTPVEQETRRIRTRSRIPSATSRTTTTRPSTRAPSETRDQENQNAVENPIGDSPHYRNQVIDEGTNGAGDQKNQNAVEDPIGDFPLYHNLEDKENATNESESEDEYMVMLTDRVEGMIKDRLLAKDFSVEALTTILENVFGESGEHLPKRGAMPRKSTFGEEDKGVRRISLGYYSHGGLRGICNKSAEYASFSVYMKHYILHYHPEARWTSMASFAEQRGQNPRGLPQPTGDPQLPHLRWRLLLRRRIVARSWQGRTGSRRAGDR